jgi:agmatine deiminase
LKPLATSTRSNKERITPCQAGYRMPAEWEPHKATWLAWPHNRETWSDDQLESVKDVWVEIVRVISPGEKVRLLVNDDGGPRRKQQRGSGLAERIWTMCPLSGSRLWTFG